MRRIIIVTLLVLFGTAACELSRQAKDEERITAASVFTNHYAQSRLSRWNVRGYAAGTDCGVLFVETSIILEDSMVEALHYGAGAYGAYKGGVLQFSRDRAFRGVAYRDSSKRVWAFGNVSRDEAEALAPCR